MNDLNLPFEPQEPTPMDLHNATVTPGVIVLSATVPVEGADLMPMPALVFRFSDGVGGFLPPVMLLLPNRDEAAKFPGMVADAVARALEATA